MAEMTPEEIAAIRAEFAVPVAMEDAQNGTGRNMRPMQMPQAMPGGCGVPPAQAPQYPGMPQSVPQQYPSYSAPSAPAMLGQSPAYPYPPQQVGPVVYEDGGQKFMIKNGCIFKQTWTTIENGGECRMFDIKRGKKVQPKGIVIQKYDWVPLAAMEAIGSALTSERPRARRKMPAQRPVRAPVAQTVAPVQVAESPCDVPQEHSVQQHVAVDPVVEQKPVVKDFVPLKKPEPAATQPVAKQSVRKPSVPNAGVVKKPGKPVSNKED